MNLKILISIAAFLVLFMAVGFFTLERKSKENNPYRYVAPLEAAATIDRSGLKLFDSVCVCLKEGEKTPLVCKKQKDGTLWYVTAVSRSDAILTADIGLELAQLEGYHREGESRQRILNQILKEIEFKIQNQSTK